jgi:hypothetical protein
MSALIGWLLFFALCIYNALDVYQTKLLFDLGCMEGNPILLNFIRSDIDWYGIMMTKIIVLSFLGMFLLIHTIQRRGI